MQQRHRAAKARCRGGLIFVAKERAGASRPQSAVTASWQRRSGEAVLLGGLHRDRPCGRVRARTLHGVLLVEGRVARGHVLLLQREGVACGGRAWPEEAWPVGVACGGSRGLREVWPAGGGLPVSPGRASEPQQRSRRERHLRRQPCSTGSGRGALQRPCLPRYARRSLMRPVGQGEHRHRTGPSLGRGLLDAEKLCVLSKGFCVPTSSATRQQNRTCPSRANKLRV